MLDDGQVEYMDYIHIVYITMYIYVDQKGVDQKSEEESILRVRVLSYDGDKERFQLKMLGDGQVKLYRYRWIRIHIAYIYVDLCRLQK